MQPVRQEKCISHLQGKNILFMYEYEYIISLAESEEGDTFISSNFTRPYGMRLLGSVIILI
jgi:hypothetical protein